MSSILKIPLTFAQKLKSGRNLTRYPCVKDPKKDEMYRLRKFAFNWMGYNKYGLYSNDIIAYDLPVVREALRRLPRDVVDARNFRLIRAMQLNFLKIYLPREKWITYEQDLEYRYLQPYVDEVVTEKLEIREFGCVNYEEDDWPAHEVR